jgi:hypothetical protein
MAATTRKLIEHSFLALLDSGIDYRNKNIGCYMSASLGDLMTVAEPVSYQVLLEQETGQMFDTGRVRCSWFVYQLPRVGGQSSLLHFGSFGAILTYRYRM